MTSVMFSASAPTAAFCTKDCITAIDNFFDDLDMGVAGKPAYWLRAKGIRFADAFMYFDTDNRFGYRGTNTQAPCHNDWMRDVCMTIYPVKQAHVDLMKNSILSRNAFTKEGGCEAGTGGDAKCGNYRAIQPTTDAHSVMIITNEYSAMVLLLIVIVVVAGVLCMFCTICCCCYCCKYKKLKA